MSAETRLADLESRLMFQEELLQKLNMDVYRQDERLAELEKQLQQVIALLQHLAKDGGVVSLNEEAPPPHY